MTISPSSPRGLIDWQGFSIGSANSVEFENGRGATRNRVAAARHPARRIDVGNRASLILRRYET